MARDFNGTSDRMDMANVWDNSATNQTIAMWVFPDSVANNQYFFSGFDSGGTNLGGIILWTGANTDGRILLTGRLATSDVLRGCVDDTLSITSWQHIAATWDGGIDAGTGIKIYHNGTECTYSDDSDGVGSGLAAMDGDHEIGGRHTGARYYNGRIAELGHWDRELSATEIAQLAASYTPLFIPNGLRIYPLQGMIRNTPHNYIGGETVTLNGTAVVEHPRIIPFSEHSTGFGIAATVPALGGLAGLALLGVG